MRSSLTPWMLALGLGAALCGCTHRSRPSAGQSARPSAGPAGPAAPAPAQPAPTAAKANATRAAATTRGPLPGARVAWLDDDHFQLASNHVFEAGKDCLTMPYQGRQVEFCHREIQLDSQWDPGPDAVASPDGERRAWLVAERTDTTVFCWRYEGAEPSEPRCYAVPILGISPELARHPVFRFLQDARTIYVVDPSHIARTDILHALSPDLPPHNQSADCVEISVEIDEMMGELRLLEPPLSVNTGTYQGSEVTFVYHVHFDAGLSGEALTAHASVRASGTVPFGNAEAFCDHDIGEVTGVTREHVELEHEGQSRRWYSNRHACQSDAGSQSPSRPIGPCVNWHRE